MKGTTERVSVKKLINMQLICCQGDLGKSINLICGNIYIQSYKITKVENKCFYFFILITLLCSLYSSIITLIFNFKTWISLRFHFNLIKLQLLTQATDYQTQQGSIVSKYAFSFISIFILLANLTIVAIFYSNFWRRKNIEI